MDDERFKEAVEKVLPPRIHAHPPIREGAEAEGKPIWKSAGATFGGIGTLGERTLHAALKYYYEPHAENHEVPVGGFVADIVGERGIVEIQTGSFYKLREKLAAFLEAAQVTVVYPVAAEKHICVLNGDTGEVVSRRKSPKKGSVYEIFGELSEIRDFLTHENFRLRILLVNIDEYRIKTEKKRYKSKGYVRAERIPTALTGEIVIGSPADFARLLPPGLPPRFTVKDFAEKSGLRYRQAGLAVFVLVKAGAVQKSGKQGHAFVYEIVHITPQ